MNNFVTGFAHSGTRVVQRLLYHAGVHVGDISTMNETYDDSWTLSDWNANATEILNEEEFKQHFEQFRQESDNWSLKNCEIMLPPNLELLHKTFKDYTMVIVMRHPIDNILIELNWPEVYPHITKDFQGDFWEKRMKFYIYLHNYFFNFFKDRKNVYVVILENLIENPREEIEKLFSFLGQELPDYDLISLVERPLSIGKRDKHYIHGGHVYCPINKPSIDYINRVKDIVTYSQGEKDFSLWDIIIDYSLRSKSSKELEWEKDKEQPVDATSATETDTPVVETEVLEPPLLEVAPELTLLEAAPEEVIEKKEDGNEETMS